MINFETFKSAIYEIEKTSILNKSELFNVIEYILFLFEIFIIIEFFIFRKKNSVQGIFKIPGYPLFGNLFQILKNPAEMYLKWSQKYNVSIFQLRLGSKIVVVVNSYEDIKSLWIKNSRANNSRPLLYTFHNLISSTRGYTVGLTPDCDSFRKKKKTISSLLNSNVVHNFNDIINIQVNYTIKNILLDFFFSHKKSNGTSNKLTFTISEFDLSNYILFFALRTTVFISYGINLDCYNHDYELSKEVVAVEGQILKFRSTVGNLQDYISVLRYLPSFKRKPLEYRKRRDKYMDYFFNTMITGIENNNTDMTNSLIGRIVNSEKKNTNLSQEEIQSICLTMVSAGLDNISLNFVHMIKVLSQSDTLEIQEKAYSEILKTFENDGLEAWNKVSEVMDCEYILAIIKETLRFFTVLPLGLPRSTTKEIIYKKIKIPKNTILLMNAYSGNHDSEIFKNPYTFSPERWLGKNMNLRSDFDHFSFGAGSRMCSGNHLARKELYTLVCRMILLFKIMPVISSKSIDLHVCDKNYLKKISPNSFLFKMRFELRVHKNSHTFLNKIFN